MCEAGFGCWFSEILLLEEVDDLVHEAAALSGQSVLTVASLNQHVEQFLALILRSRVKPLKGTRLSLSKQSRSLLLLIFLESVVELLRGAESLDECSRQLIFVVAI